MLTLTHRLHRAGHCVLGALLVLATPYLCPASTLSWSNTAVNNTLWSTAADWNSGTVPGTTDDAWFNLANNYALVDASVAAHGHQIIIGRDALSTRLDITGGSITSNDEFFIGQYSDASGVVNMTGGSLTSLSNLTVGGTGSGSFYMSGGTTNVTGVFYVDRYTGSAASGYVDIFDGTVNAGTLKIGPTGSMFLDNTTLTLSGDQHTTVMSYMASNALASAWGTLAPLNYWAPPPAPQKAVVPLAVNYSSGTGKTTVSAANGREIGILNFASGLLDQRTITYDYTGVRQTLPAPAVGVHPRLFFNAEELPEIRSGLQSTAVGQEAFKMIQIHTGFLRNGRSAYDALPPSSKTMPDGTPRIPNEGFVDKSADYTALVNGDPSVVASDSGPGPGVLAGEMALEAFECLVDAGQTGVAQRQINLANALNTWALWALSQSNLTSTSGAQFGGMLNALTYDLCFNAMTASQQANVRKALSQVMDAYYKAGYYGVGVAPEATTSNWTALYSYELVLACAIEGEVPTSDAGYTSAQQASYFTNAMMSFDKFFTFGWWSDGAPYEGQGKNYTYAGNLIAFARRGYDFFGHPNLQAYSRQWMSAITQPYGYAFTSYDVIGGTDMNETAAGAELGGHKLNGSDFIGQKWMFPNDPGTDFAFRNFISTQYRVAGTSTLQSFLDLRSSNVPFYANGGYPLLLAAIFASDFSQSGTWTSQNAAALGSLDYLDTQGGTLVSRSSYDPTATQLLVHIRQDFGGHTNADRNTFDLSALQRIFFNYDTSGSQVAGLQDDNFHSVIIADDLGMYVTPEEGDKCRVPAKLAAWQGVGSANACFVSGDATYAYSNAWRWDHNSDGTPKLDPNYTEENVNNFNTFRRSNNQITDSYGNTPFWTFPNWDVAAPAVEGMQKQSYNPMRQVYRTIGLVRGVEPYVLVVDDVRKDDATHDYKWLASTAKDLSIVTGSALPTGCNPATDVVLQEPAATGNRNLLVRIIEADGTPTQASGTTGSTLAYLQTLADPINENMTRLVIERASTVAPNFRILLFPFVTGDTLPTTTYGNNVLTVTLGSQKDTVQFYPRTATVAGQSVTMNEFTLTRAGSTLIDYRNQIEPVPVR